jgi:hypothetical protein
LLAKHRLEVPPGVAVMLTKTVLKCRVLKRRPKQMGTKLPRRKRMQSALKHARKLLEYKRSKPSHPGSVPSQARWLYDSLSDAEVVMWLALARPCIDVPTLLARAAPTGPGRRKLSELVRALEFYLSQEGKRTGRPKGRYAAVVTGGCIAWVRAGKKLSPEWNAKKKHPRGPLVSFVRDLLMQCGVKMTEIALGSALYVAIPDVERRHRSLHPL